MQAQIWRPFFAASKVTTQSLYAGDTIRLGRLTANAALRFDRSAASMLESAQGANPAFPDAAAGDCRAGGGQPDRVQPAVAARRRQLRARRVGDARCCAPATACSAASSDRERCRASPPRRSRSSSYAATDRNGNNIADPGELDELIGWTGVDPDDPGSGVNFNRVDPDLTSPKTHEFVIGVDREVMTNFAVSASVHVAPVQRRDLDRHRSVVRQHRVSAGRRDRADYVPGRCVTGHVLQESATTASRLRADRIGAAAGQRRRVSQSARLSPALPRGSRCRRPSAWPIAGWRASGSRPSSHREYLDDPSLAMQDPTSTTIFPNIDGGVGRDAVVWQRQERDVPASRRAISSTPPGCISCRGASTSPATSSRARALASRSSRPRSPAIRRPPRSACCSSIRMNRGCQASCRSTCASARRSTFRGRELAFDLDLFNVLNRSTVLGRQYDVTATGSTGFNQPLEIMNPRLLRFGVRFRF